MAFGPTWVFVAAAAVIAITCLDVMILGPKTNGRMLEVVTGTGQQSELPRGVAA